MQQIKQQLTQLETKIKNLEQLRTTKKDAYDKYCEECSKAKEIRDNQSKFLKETITFERVQMEESINSALEQGNSDEQLLIQNHQETMTKLEKDNKDYEKKYTTVLQ